MAGFITETTNGKAPKPIRIPPGQLIRRSSRLDDFRQYLSDSPDASKFAGIMRRVDQGEVGSMIELCEEMEGKDAHLQGVAATRRLALTALDWEIVPAVDEANQALADETAAYCAEVLDEIDTWEDTLQHLATAIGPNVAVSELIWANGTLVGTYDVPGKRLLTDWGRTGQLLIETDEVPMGIPAMPGKFVVYHPNSRGGFPFYVTMARAQAFLYLIRHFVVADWSAFCEIFGMPVRVGKYAEGASDDDVRDLQTMLREMGTDGWATFPVGTEVEFLTVARSDNPFQAMIEWCEKKTAILWLGQTLTSDIGDAGSRAAAQVHDNVRKDLLIADCKGEARCIRDQIFRPLCHLKWPGVAKLPIPHFKRQITDVRDTEAERLDLEKLRFGMENGLAIDESYMRDALDIPAPTTEDVRQKPDQISLDGLYPLLAGLEKSALIGDEILMQQFREKIAAMIGYEGSLPEMPIPDPEIFGVGSSSKDKTADPNKAPTG